jgi:hydrogen cyanide synthase HcnC
MACLDIPVRPIRGQIVGTETLPEMLSACLSTTDCYLAQKQHGEIIIGSTTEESGFDVDVTPTAVRTLAAGAVRAVPFLARAGVKRTWSGLRPATPDELPILGPVEGLSGYLNACGHFRTGILTSPLTGRLIAEMICGEPPSFPIEPFLLSRFAAAENEQLDPY